MEHVQHRAGNQARLGPCGAPAGPGYVANLRLHESPAQGPDLDDDLGEEKRASPVLDLNLTQEIEAIHADIIELTLLDTESAGVAEIAYEERFKREVKTLDEAVRLAVNKHRAPNVRFYAACLVAERLFISDELVVTDTLKRVDVAPMIDAQFIGGNRLTARFYAQGRAQPHLTVRQVIEQRLLDLRTFE